MSSYYLKIIASDKVFFQGKVEKVIIPGVDGERAILAHHENVVVAVNIGTIRFQLENGEWVETIVGLGFLQMMNNRATILVETAERPEDIDMVRAKEAKERAEEQLRQKLSEKEYHHVKSSLARAMARLSETSRMK